MSSMTASRVQVLAHSTPVDVGDTLPHNPIGRCQGRRVVHDLASLSSNARFGVTPATDLNIRWK
jgi:hypothetical protein